MAYERGWARRRELPLPSVAVGNLTVGGSGKTPIASWIAAYYVAASGTSRAFCCAGIAAETRCWCTGTMVPEAVVIGDPDRSAGAERALAEGAQVLVLDDAYQRLDVWRDLNIAVVSAETTRAVPWSLPAGPWREGLHALDRADALIVTRKRADAASAMGLRPRSGAADSRAGRRGESRRPALRGHAERPRGRVGTSSIGKRVVAASAIGDPEAFIAQTKATGAQVQVATWNDHHGYRDEDVAWLARAARKADLVVITQKDAVKLRDRWPASVPEPLVAALDLTWEEGTTRWCKPCMP